MEKFFNMVYRLRLIDRWNTSNCNLKESVSEHSFYVALIALLLYEIDLENNIIKENDIVLSDLLISALYHDSFECYSSHIVSPVKNVSYDANKGVVEMKKIYIGRLYSLLPEHGYSITKKALNNTNNNIIRYIELADTLEAYFFTTFEVYMDNKDFYNKNLLFKEKIKQLSSKYSCVKILVSELSDSSFEIVY